MASPVSMYVNTVWSSGSVLARVRSTATWVIVHLLDAHLLNPVPAEHHVKVGLFTQLDVVQLGPAANSDREFADTAT
jgi:hypothetical protein